MALHSTPRYLTELRRLSRRYHHATIDATAAVRSPATRWAPLIGMAADQVRLQKGRVASQDVKGGARKGFRIIRAVRGNDVVLVSIYSKSDRSDLSVDQYGKLLADALSILANLKP